jgi:hypothetical protein
LAIVVAFPGTISGVREITTTDELDEKPAERGALKEE